ncbi:uncharacterized protein LACBIDRAFT_299040 [Laccaria bicolor S238N-H82]|uniref:Predicted protein n=1 Tax=Laccaria bicolor (strain S238N-H82 / ATCC MYA-4686) TaxID=486041 RepID=B0DDW8_LACBS|nr:uncharacterized protein LACBIDRAFT_299040 [Laccaria bicolor S238N-H82]EDR07158.1 predicted protein [Laccaria bicolor S238N-H82]|eukprot:XP_001882089.1 predicted protein [Laccaria bicolor S238N-H82]
MSENVRSIREESPLKNVVNGFKSSRKRVMLDLVLPTRRLYRIHDPSLFFGLLSFTYWATRRLPSSFPPLSQVPPPPPPPSQTLPPIPEDPDVTGKPDAIYTYRQADAGVTSCSWALACVPLF